MKVFLLDLKAMSHSKKMIQDIEDFLLFQKGLEQSNTRTLTPKGRQDLLKPCKI